MQMTQRICRGLAALTIAALAIGIFACGSQDGADLKLLDTKAQPPLKEKAAPRTIEIDHPMKKN